MTPVPPPASPCVRAHCTWNRNNVGAGGIRFFLSYSGSSPSGANCATLASDIATAWGSQLASLWNPDWVLQEVDVLDIATETGLSGQWTGSVPGTNTGTPLPDQCCVNVEYGIGRRYRGGKPRSYFPGGSTDDLNNESTYTSAYLALVNTGVAGFFSALAGLDIGSMGTLSHVNLSYYKGFTNVTNSSGREKAVPTYRDAALVDTVTGYSAKAVIGSQRRRRTSAT